MKFRVVSLAVLDAANGSVSPVLVLGRETHGDVGNFFITVQFIHNLSLTFSHCICIGSISSNNSGRVGVQRTVDNDDRDAVIRELIGYIGTDGVSIGGANNDAVNTFQDSCVDQVHLLGVVVAGSRSYAVTFNTRGLQLFQSGLAAIVNNGPEVTSDFGVQASQAVSVIFATSGGRLTGLRNYGTLGFRRRLTSSFCRLRTSS